MAVYNYEGPLCRDIYTHSIWITHYLGNTTVQERYEQHSLGNEVTHKVYTWRLKCACTVLSGKKRKKPCGTCTGCLHGNCGVCKFCLDMPVFGGLGRRKQRCIKRRCTGITYSVEINFFTDYCVWLYNSGSDTAQHTSGQPLQQKEVCTISVP